MLVDGWMGTRPAWPGQHLGCGELSTGFASGGHGYGLITLSLNMALIEAKDDGGRVVKDNEGKQLSLNCRLEAILPVERL